MRFQHLLGALLFLAGQAALADLTCHDFYPHNWTSPRARLYFYDQDDNFVPTDPLSMPANLSATSPLTLAPKSSSGSIFHLRKCTSKSLGLNSTDETSCPMYGKLKKKHLLGKRREGACTEEDENERCTRAFTSWIQIVDPATGHCWTWQQVSPKLAHYNFIPCDPNPTNKSQILEAYRTYSYSENDDLQRDKVCDWGVDFHVFPQIIVTGSGVFQPWKVAADNKTLVSTTHNFPNAYYVNAEHHDPLTDYSGKKIDAGAGN